MSQSTPLPEKLLVVDDERIVAEDLCECLMGMGFEVCGPAKSGPEAVALAHEHKPDLVLMDIVLQGDMDGVDAARLIRDQLAIPCIFLSAYSDKGVLDRAKKINPLGYIVKPFQEEGLRTTVEVALHRVRMDRAVSTNAEWFGTTLMSIADAVVAVDGAGVVTFVNQAAEKLGGRVSSGIVGRPVAEVFGLVDLEKGGAPMGHPVVDAIASEKEVRWNDNRSGLVTEAGDVVPVEAVASPIHGKEGGIVGAVLILADITERRRAEQDREKRSRELEHLVQARTREIQKVNTSLAGEIEERKRVEEALRYRMGIQQFVRTVMNRFLTAEPAETDSAIDATLSQLGSFSGADAVFLVEFSPGVRSREDEVVLTHEWRRDGERLSASSGGNLKMLGDWARQIGEGASDTVLVADQGGAASAIADARGAQTTLLVPLVAAGRISGFLGIDAKAPTRKWSREDGGLLRMAADVLLTARRRENQAQENEQLIQQLYQAQKMEAIGKLSGGIAHDFNNMLLPIIGYSDLLIQKATEAGIETSEELSEIRRAAKRAAGLTRQMLTFSRKQVVQKRVIHVREHLAGAEVMLARIIGEDFKLVTRYAEGIPPVSADPGQLEQVLMNLVVNARDAMPQGGSIFLATAAVDSAKFAVPLLGGAKPEGMYVAVTVRDTGVGLDPAIKTKIFEPFFSTKGADGTGLGLSVVYGIIEQHDGGLNVESREGQGSAFTVFLPAVEATPEMISEASSSDESPSVIEKGKGERILLIEDESAVLQFVSQALSQNGYEIVTAMSCAEAREAFSRERGRFDMIFSDAVLPDGNGVMLLDEFLKVNPGLPALLSSGYTDKDSLVELAKQRDITFLQKPYSLPVLMQTVQEVAGAKGMAMELT